MFLDQGRLRSPNPQRAKLQRSGDNCSPEMTPGLPHSWCSRCPLPSEQDWPVRPVGHCGTGGCDLPGGPLGDTGPSTLRAVGSLYHPLCARQLSRRESRRQPHGNDSTAVPARRGRPPRQPSPVLRCRPAPEAPGYSTLQSPTPGLSGVPLPRWGRSVARRHVPAAPGAYGQ